MDEKPVCPSWSRQRGEPAIADCKMTGKGVQSWQRVDIKVRHHLPTLLNCRFGIGSDIFLHEVAFKLRRHHHDFAFCWPLSEVSAYQLPYPWAPAFRESYQQEVWQRGTFDQIPVDLQVTTTDFLRESSGYDCSIEDSIRIKLPSAHIINAMKLRSYASEGEYFDPSGKLVAFDPSVKSPGPGALLFEKVALQRFLEANELTLFWTVCGEKQLIGGNDRTNLGWMQVSGVFQLKDQGVTGHVTPEYRTTARQRRMPRKRSPNTK